MKNILIQCFFSITCILSVKSQVSDKLLRVRDEKERTCFDVSHYDLHIKISPTSKYLTGFNTISFSVLQNTNRIHLDLAKNLKIDSVLFENQKCTLERIGNNFYVTFPRTLNQGEHIKTSVYYQGNPIVAKKAPWDGGFVFSKDNEGKPFIGVACQELGAYSWWPNKYTYSDKCDSADLYFEVPSDLQAISNGKFIESISAEKNTVYHWKVSYPINNYNISVTIGDFVHFQDIYTSKKDKLTLDYYVLKDHLKNAEKQFKQVKPMLKIYESLFGKYPFWNDGYKLIETPYLGMEHQSGIAYGNGFQNGYSGHYFTPVYSKFDFIIIHESGHEYWGNNVCMKNLSDMWIHEAFCTYSELLYVEKRFGKKQTSAIVDYWKMKVQNRESLVNDSLSDDAPTSDIYYKGALMLHTIRTVINNDKLFLACLKAIQQKFSLQTISTTTLIQFMNSYLKADLTPIFQHYLYEVSPPLFSYRYTPNENGKGYLFSYKFDATNDGFMLPVSVSFGNKKYNLKGTSSWQEVVIDGKYHEPKIDESKAYFLISYE
jgi:aminopeptidase N